MQSAQSFSAMRDVPSGSIPDVVSDSFEIHNWRNAFQILIGSYPVEWWDIVEVLSGPATLESSSAIGEALIARRWEHCKVSATAYAGDMVRASRTHEIGYLKARVAFDVAWIRKDHTRVIDLDKFRLAFDLQVVDVAIITTQTDQLQQPNIIGAGTVSDPSVALKSELLSRLQAGEAGGCPAFVLGGIPSKANTKRSPNGLQ